jgi:hypothetical protein
MADYDAMFSGGKLNSETPKKVDSKDDDMELSAGFEITLKDDSSFTDDTDIPASISDSEFLKSEAEDEANIEDLADDTLDIADVDSVADFLGERGEDVDPNHLEKLTEEETTMFESSENSEPNFENLAEVENPEKKPEMSDESLNRLEDQIKKVAELTEKLNFATENVVAVTDSKARNPEKEPSLEENLSEPGESEESVPGKNDSPSINVVVPAPEEEKNQAAETEEPSIEESEGLEEIIEPESSELDSSKNMEDDADTVENSESESFTPDEIIDDELLNEEDLSDESESEDFLEDVPYSLQEESFGEAELIADEEVPVKIESENRASQAAKESKEELALRRAIDMLPTIAASVEDRSLTYRYREYLELFKTLRNMLEYLPPSQQKEFMMSKNRVMLDFIISKLSGKAGLFATSKALIRSGLLHENQNARGQDLEGIPLAREVLEYLRELGTKLTDDYLRDALDTEALKVLEKF